MLTVQGNRAKLIIKLYMAPLPCETMNFAPGN